MIGLEILEAQEIDTRGRDGLREEWVGYEGKRKEREIERERKGESRRD